MIGSACLAAKTRPILRITLVLMDNAASCLRHAPGSSSRGGWKFARLAAGGRRIRTCMGLFLSSGCLWFVAGSLFGAGKPFFVPSPAIRFAERAEGVKGPKREQSLA